MTTSHGSWHRIALTAFLAITGCGFAPVGEVTANSARVSVDIADSDLRREFVSYLEKRNISVSDEAPLHIRIVGGQKRDIVSLTNSGTVNKYRLSYRVRLELSRNGEIVGENSFVLREVLSHNESRYLGKRLERERVYRSMRGFAMDRIWFHVLREIRSS